MLRRYRPLLGLALSLTCAGAILSPAVDARAQSLQDCPPTSAGSPRLPIGYPNSTQLFLEKKALRNYIAGLQLADVDLPTPRPAFVDPIDLYILPGSQTQYTGGNCQPGVLLPSAYTSAQKQELERLWFMWTHGNETWDHPTLSMLGLDGQAFLLSSMENTGTCTAQTPRMDWDPTLTWVANWPYQGNPYYTQPALRNALKKRGAAWLAMQLIMLDWNNWGGTLPTTPPVGTVFAHPLQGRIPPAPGVQSMNVGFELAGYLGHLAYTYLQVRDLFAPNDPLLTHMQTMLRMYSERLHVWTGFSGMTNLDIRATYAHYYIWLATGDPAVHGFYLDSVNTYYGTQSTGIFFPAGYFFDTGRFDSGYNEWNIRHTMRLLEIDPSPPPSILSAAEKLFDLHAHLTFRDPDGTFYSPNEFNTRASKSAISPVMTPNPRDSEGGSLERFMPAVKPRPGLPHGLPYAQAFMRDVEILGPQANNWWVNGGHLNPGSSNYYSELICQMSGKMGYYTLGARTIWPSSSTAWPSPAGARNYHSPAFGVELFTGADVTNWRNASTPALEEFPFEHDGTHVKSFENEFVYVKHGRADASHHPYAALIHAGPVGPGDTNVGSGQAPYFLPHGFGGGQISMFWGPFTGAAVRGMRRGHNNPPVDDWNEWRAWPMHALSMESANGDWTSSSLIVNPRVDVSYYAQPVPSSAITSDVANSPCSGMPGGVGVPPIAPATNAAATLVRVCGNIPDQVRRFSLVPPQVLSAPLPYSRAMYADEDGVYVRTTIEPSNCEALSELWETIPLYDQYWQNVTNYPPARIYFIDAGGSATPAFPGMLPMPETMGVYVARAEGAFEIVFSEPQEVGLSDTWVKGDASSNNVMVRVAPSDIPGYLCKPATVDYHLHMVTDGDGYTPPF